MKRPVKKSPSLHGRTIAAPEYHLKIKGTLDAARLIQLGAHDLGSTMHEDRYYRSKRKLPMDEQELVRVRNEGGEQYYITYRMMINRRATHADERAVGVKDLPALLKKYEEVLAIHKERFLYLLDGVLINLDKVEGLGPFIEFAVDKTADQHKVDAVMRKLGLEGKNAIQESYYELTLQHQKQFHRLMEKVHEKFGRFAFGISSGVLTTLGIMVGLNSATASKLAVISGIVGVAVSDSLSDAMGMYASKKSERGVSNARAMTAALSTWVGKVIFTLSFIIPFTFLQFGTAISVCIAWGLLLLAFVNIQIAFVQEESIPKAVARNLLIAILIIALSYGAGMLVARFIG